MLSLVKYTSGTYPIDTPFGRRYYVNADYTASGTVYKPIESFIREEVLKYYANTHSNAHNGQLMASYMTQAKNLVRRSVNALPCDKVIYTGNGCSGAIMHIMHLLELSKPTTPESVVYVSVAEHHSNYLPWTHMPVKLIVVPINEDGTINIDYLTRSLIKYQGRQQICSFIAGSNVTGVLQPVHEISALVHRHKGLIFWDYAGCAPYVAIDMHRDDQSYFDAIFISPHKFLGGPGTPGLLIANYRIFKNSVPFCPGGGTVRFVSDDIKKYSDNLEQRESGGTPNIIGSIKVGLVFQLKDELLPFITQREREINAKVRRVLYNMEGLDLINPIMDDDAEQVPIYSFKIEGLHYNFIVALLNDLFGIQSRGGVSCCSIFAHYLLSNNRSKQKAIYKQIVTDHGVPAGYGWCRVTFHYTMEDHVIDYILSAIAYVVKYGKLFVSQYHYEEVENHWVHNHFKHEFPELNYRNASRKREMRLTPAILEAQLAAALRLANAMITTANQRAPKSKRITKVAAH